MWKRACLSSKESDSAGLRLYALETNVSTILDQTVVADGFNDSTVLPSSATERSEH